MIAPFRNVFVTPNPAPKPTAQPPKRAPLTLVGPATQQYRQFYDYAARPNPTPTAPPVPNREVLGPPRPDGWPMQPNAPQQHPSSVSPVPQNNLIGAATQEYRQFYDYTAGQPFPTGARPQQGYAGGGYAQQSAGYDVPYGVDPVWYRQFISEHEGTTPEQMYRRDGDYALAHALSDKAWGDQFYRTYGRPPSDYDWKYSYYDRQRNFYGG